MQLNESLFPGDLVNIVVPLVSIDQFESKIDDQSIVLAFFCEEEDAAYDLAFFVEKGPVDVLDTEVSPAPDEDGRYVVFVEVNRNRKFPEVLEQLLKNVSYLCDIEDWKITVYGDGGKQRDFSKEIVAKLVTLDSESLTEMASFFDDSLSTIQVSGKHLSMASLDRAAEFAIEHFGELETVEPLLENASPQISMQDSVVCSSIIRMLGPTWDVQRYDDKVLVIRENQAILLRPLR